MRIINWLRDLWDILWDDGMSDEEREEFHRGGGL